MINSNSRVVQKNNFACHVWNGNILYVSLCFKIQTIPNPACSCSARVRNKVLLTHYLACTSDFVCRLSCCRWSLCCFVCRCRCSKSSLCWCNSRLCCSMCTAWWLSIWIWNCYRTFTAKQWKHNTESLGHDVNITAVLTMYMLFRNGKQLQLSIVIMATSWTWQQHQVQVEFVLNMSRTQGATVTHEYITLLLY